MKKIISLMLSVILMVSLATVSYAAANFTVTVDKDSVNIGDTVTVIVEAKTLTCQNFNASFGWNKDVFTCTSISWDRDSDIGYQAFKGWISVSDVTKANNTGYVGWTGGGAEDSEYAGGALCTVVLTATAAGTSNITYTEDTTGTSAYKAAETTIDTVKVIDPNASTKDEEKTVDAGVLNNTAETKTFQATIGADLVGTGVTAVLAHPEKGTQEVGLTFDGWSGEAKAVFNIVVKFLDYANAADTTLSFK